MFEATKYARAQTNQAGTEVATLLPSDPTPCVLVVHLVRPVMARRGILIRDHVHMCIFVVAHLRPKECPVRPPDNGLGIVKLRWWCIHVDVVVPEYLIFLLKKRCKARTNNKLIIMRGTRFCFFLS